MEEEQNHKNDDKKMILKSNHEKRIDSFKSQESDKNLNHENHIPLQEEAGVVTLEEAFEIVKGNQLSQWFYGLTLGLSFSFCGMFAYSFAFQSKYPDFECKSRQHPNWYPCTREDVCQNGEDIAGFKYRYNADSAYTINNWITSMNIECAPEYQIGLFGSLYFIGVCIGAGTLLRLADIRGRKPVLLFSLALNMLITFLLCITNDLFITYLLVILNGIVIAPRVSISYLYMMEVIQESKKKLFNFISCICDAFSVIFIAAYFYFIKSGISIFYIYIVYGTITLIILFFIPESPHYLYAKCRFNELRECFNNYQ